MRPNIHIEDVTDLYVRALQWPSEKIKGKIYNAGYDNRRVQDIADTVSHMVGPDVQIVTVPTDDNRSYHISSAKIKEELGFQPTHTIEDAVHDLIDAFDADRIPNSMTNDYYYNIKRMQQLNLR